MLSGIPNHSIILWENERCVIGRIRLHSHLFWIRMSCLNVSSALYFSGLEQNSYNVFPDLSKEMLEVLQAVRVPFG